MNLPYLCSKKKIIVISLDNMTEDKQKSAYIKK